MRPMRAFLLLFALLAPGAPLLAQTLEGRVRDAATEQPLAQATITALDDNGRVAARVRSDDDGAFVLRMRSPGGYRIRGERIGHQPSISQPLEVGLRQTLEVELRLSVGPVPIEPLTVTTRREPPRLRALENVGFYRRELEGRGHHLRREDIERYTYRDFAQLLDRVPGTSRAVDRNGQQYIYFDRAQGGNFGGNAVCLPQLYLDGSRIGYSRGVAGMDVNAAVTPEHIEAVELYRSASEVPVEYNSDAKCGVILIWTRVQR